MAKPGGKSRRPAGRVAVVAGLILGGVLAAGGASPQGPPIEVLSDWLRYNNTGWQALERGRLDRAEQAFRLAIERMRPYEASAKVPLARSYSDLARVLQRKGHHDQARPLAKWALAVRETAPGKKSESLCQCLEQLAEIEVARGRDRDAEPLLARLVAVREKALGAGHADLIPAVEALAALHARGGRLADAEPFYRRALALREANHAESLKQAEEQEKMAALLRLMITADGATAGAQAAVGRSAQAQRLESRARSLREASAESVSAAVMTEGYAALLRRAGRAGEANDLQARALAIRDAAQTRAARARAAADR